MELYREAFYEVKVVFYINMLFVQSAISASDGYALKIAQLILALMDRFF